MPRIAFKPAAATPELASARLRAYLPVKYLCAAGHDCEIFDADHFDQYQLIVFQKAYTADDLALASGIRRRGGRAVLDLCDNHLFDPENRPIFRERAERLRRMLDVVDAVTVSTPELAKYVGRPATVIDDALDEISPDPLAAGRRWLRRFRRGPLRLVWFGNAGQDYPPFGLIDLARLIEPLNELHRQVPIRLTVISNSSDLFARHTAGAAFPMRYREYRTATFQRMFRRHDVCLIPVTINPFTICKTVNRPALSLLLGVPAIADFIPSYEELRDFVPFGDWAKHLQIYANDPELRRRHVRQGRDYLRAKYHPGRVVQQWADAMGRSDSRAAA